MHNKLKEDELFSARFLTAKDYLELGSTDQIIWIHLSVWLKGRNPFEDMINEKIEADIVRVNKSPL